MISTKSDTSDEEQHVEENPNDEKTPNVAKNKNVEKNSTVEEDRNVEGNSNNEEDSNVEENLPAAKAESEEINVDTFVVEIIAKAQEESFAGSSKCQKMMARKNVSSWYPLRLPFKVVSPLIKQGSSRIKSKITSDPN